MSLELVTNLQFKLRESESQLQIENQNLQADLKSLIGIEQALRRELNKVGQKCMASEAQLEQMKGMF